MIGPRGNLYVETQLKAWFYYHDFSLLYYAKYLEPIYLLNLARSYSLARRRAYVFPYFFRLENSYESH